MSRIGPIAASCALVAAGLALAGAGCATSASPSAAAIAAAGRVEADGIRQAMADLADDGMEGRGTGETGYLRAAAYVVRRLEAAGLQPAGDAGGWYQSVPLIASTVRQAACSADLLVGESSIDWSVEREALIAPDPRRSRAELTAPVMFVGYGVSAPEIGYDDYVGIGVEGAVVAMFGGAPATLPHDERAFHASSRGKRSVAARHGAVGILWLSTPDERDRTSWERIVRQHRLPSMHTVGDDGRPEGVEESIVAEAMLSAEAQDELLRAADLDAGALVADLDAGTPRSVATGARVRLVSATDHRRLDSPNVVGRLPGSDPGLADEYVAVTAHLDHLGIGEPVDGDAIYNGAYDNASGVAILLQLVEAVAGSADRPRRSLLFLASTGEEEGLLGSRYWTGHPTVPIDDVVAEFNLDMVLMRHPLRDVVAFGAEHSSLRRPVEAAAAHEGVALTGDPFPEEVLFVRSDQYPFVRHGVPSVFLAAGVRGAGDEASGLAAWRDWMKTVYHSPKDDMSQPIDEEAGAKFARINLLAAWMVADADARPRWNDGDFFGDQFGERSEASSSRSSP